MNGFWVNLIRKFGGPYTKDMLFFLFLFLALKGLHTDFGVILVGGVLKPVLIW